MLVCRVTVGKPCFQTAVRLSHVAACAPVSPSAPLSISPPRLLWATTSFLPPSAPAPAFLPLHQAHKIAHSPPGHHSVIGQPTPGGLSYREYVIYRGEQAYPEFMLTYRLKP